MANQGEARFWRLKRLLLRLEVGKKPNPVHFSQAAELPAGQIKEVERRQRLTNKFLGIK